MFEVKVLAAPLSADVRDALASNDVRIISYSTLLYSTLLYSTLLYSTLLYSTLLYSTDTLVYCVASNDIRIIL